MERQKRLLGFYNYTVVLTYIGMLAGFTGIVCAMEKNFRSALVCLLVAGVCDMFDGAVASTMERTAAEKRFGIQIDSLSDLICFGALPALFVCSLGGKNYFCFGAAGVYLLCTLIRLAYFNVLEEERQSAGGGRRTCYLGMPVTMIAVFLPALNAMCRYRRSSALLPYCALLLFSSVAYLCPVTIRKPKVFGKIVLVMLGVVEVAALGMSMFWDV